jgi:hypothetical protein
MLCKTAPSASRSDRSLTTSRGFAGGERERRKGKVRAPLCNNDRRERVKRGSRALSIAHGSTVMAAGILLHHTWYILFVAKRAKAVVGKPPARTCIRQRLKDLEQQ